MTPHDTPGRPARTLRPMVYEQRHLPPRWAHAVIAFLAWLTILMVLNQIPRPAGSLEVGIETQIPHITHARLYFDAGRGINAQDSVHTWVRPGRNILRFDLPPGEFRLFRLDPAPGPYTAHIDSIAIRPSRQEGPQAIPLAQVRIGEQIADLRHRDNRLIVIPVATASHPQLLIDPGEHIVIQPQPRSALVPIAEATGIVLLLLAIWFGLLAPVWTWSTGITLGILAVFLLAGAMAFGSTPFAAVHPDENAHVWAFQYYLDRLLPVAVDHPALVRSISVYGFSYLFELDVVYALAARTAGALTSWFASDMAAARCFNLALLLGLGCMALRNPRHALCLGVVLLSPQVWYVFSYFNADAFPLTLSLVAACLISHEESGLNRYIDGRQRLGIGVMIVALAIGLLLVSKRNYLPLVPVFGLWLAVRHLDLGWRAVALVLAALLLLGSAIHLNALPGWPGSGRAATLAGIGALLLGGTVFLVVRRWWRTPGARPIFMRLATVFALAVAVAAPRLLFDIALNGPPGQKAATLEHIAEVHAGHGFKPSQLGEDFAYAGRAVAQRGHSLNEVLFEPHHWVRHSLASAYGVYGYFVAFTPAWLINCLKALSLLLFMVATRALFAWRRDRAGPMVLLAVGGTLLVAINSILHSWTFDHQAQGRYLFPAFVLLALMLGTAGKHVPARLTAAIFAAAFVFGCTSFLGTALPAMTGSS